MTFLYSANNLLKSKRSYCFKVPEGVDASDLSSILIEGSRVEAFWVGGNKSGALTFGTLGVSVENHRGGLLVDTPKGEALNIDMRYGGKWHYSWDGKYFTYDVSRGLMTLEEQFEVADTMKQAMSTLPNPPQGFTNWYRA